MLGVRLLCGLDVLTHAVRVIPINGGAELVGIWMGLNRPPSLPNRSIDR